MSSNHLPDEEGALGSVDHLLDQLKKLGDDIHFGRAAHNADDVWKSWVQAHWVGAPFTVTQLRAALSLAKTATFYPFGKGAADAFARTNPRGTPNPFEEKFLSGDTAATLIRRARTIDAELLGATTPSRIATLEGALSATGLALAIVDYQALYTIPYAGTYIGAGNPADSIEAALSP